MAIGHLHLWCHPGARMQEGNKRPEPSSVCLQLQEFAEQQNWLQQAEGLKLEGNGKYKQGLYPEAIKCYERAIELLQKLRSARLPHVVPHLLHPCTLAHNPAPSEGYNRALSMPARRISPINHFARA